MWAFSLYVGGIRQEGRRGTNEVEGPGSAFTLHSFPVPTDNRVQPASE
jgi:hypothetical protein